VVLFLFSSDFLAAQDAGASMADNQVMFAKLGLILLILLAVGLAFVAGTLLPGQVIPPQAISADGAKPQPDDQTAAPGAKDAATQAGGAQDKADNSKKADKPIAYAELALPNVLPPKAQLGLQIGLFIDAGQAQPLMEQLTALGQASQVLQVTDPTGAPWALLVAGPYKSLDQARTQRQALHRSLALHHAPALLLLPPPKKKGN
jgi:hypothetical protein